MEVRDQVRDRNPHYVLVRKEEQDAVFAIELWYPDNAVVERFQSGWVLWDDMDWMPGDPEPPDTVLEVVLTLHGYKRKGFPAQANVTFKVEIDLVPDYGDQVDDFIVEQITKSEFDTFEALGLFDLWNVTLLPNGDTTKEIVAKRVS